VQCTTVVSASTFLILMKLANLLSKIVVDLISQHWVGWVA
jgi:hypothetical protein